MEHLLLVSYVIFGLAVPATTELAISEVVSSIHLK